LLLDLIGLEVFTWPQWYAWVTLGFLFLILEAFITSNYLKWAAFSAIVTGILIGLGLINKIEYQLTSIFIIYLIVLILYKVFYEQK
tara:strand:- start:847 stop:1104 length:258 start_codon:yes stop_codon:yes gene_type:complete